MDEYNTNFTISDDHLTGTSEEEDATYPILALENNALEKQNREIIRDDSKLSQDEYKSYKGSKALAVKTPIRGSNWISRILDSCIFPIFKLAVQVIHRS